MMLEKVCTERCKDVTPHTVDGQVLDKPPTEDFPKEVAQNLYEKFKDEMIITCTECRHISIIPTQHISYYQV